MGKQRHNRAPRGYRVRLEETVDHPVWYANDNGQSVGGHHMATVPARLTGGEVRHRLAVRNARGETVQLHFPPPPVSLAPEVGREIAAWLRTSAAMGPLTVVGLGSVNTVGIAAQTTPELAALVRGMRDAGARLWLYVAEDEKETLLRKHRQGFPEGVSPAQFKRDVAPHLAALYRAASGVLVFTDAQAAMMRGHDVGGPVVTIPPSLDLADVPPRPTWRDDGVRIGFGGDGDKHLHDMQPLVPVLHELAGRDDVSLEFWGGIPGVDRRTSRPIVGENYFGAGTATMHEYQSRYLDYLWEIRTLDIALAPLRDEPAKRFHWQGHWLEHAVFGTPLVASDMPPYDDFRHGETIVKVRTPEEWREALFRLVDDADERHRIGQAARDHVLAHYTTDAVAPLWRAWLDLATADDQQDVDRAA